MARKPRLFYPGAVYHVLLRGNAGQDIFYAKEDRKYFYRLLQEGHEKFGHRIHAFCLMANHVQEGWAQFGWSLSAISISRNSLVVKAIIQ